MTRTVLVTGGAGFVGSHVCKALAQAGYQPVVYDNLCRGFASAVKWGPLEIQDLADVDALRLIIKKYKIKAVMHFAAYAYVGESMSEPRLYFENNVANSLNLLNAMLDTGVYTLVVSSSCATYGVPAEIPISEDHEQKPVNPYGESKLMLERVIDWYVRTYGLNAVILRYFNAAGADPDGEIGENHENETHLLPIAIQTALGKHSHLPIFGTDYATTDGTAVRDYVHVTDLADAHVKALAHLLNGGAGGAFNLGTGHGLSVLDIVRAVERFSRESVPIKIEPRRDGDPPILVADPTRANSELAWLPHHSDLESIVETAWRWQNRLIETRIAMSA